ncbi:MAG: GTP-binding protein [Planctomycetaceae bacterium]|nr:GTP-binding protein [Planctomycetaceae bacterium]
MNSLPHPDDTIAALASAPGAAARGIIRVSGPQTVTVLRGWFVGDAPVNDASPESLAVPGRNSPWHTAGRLEVAGLQQPLPVNCYLWPGRRSYTGEPLAELHTVGSPPVLEALLADLASRGVRPAGPGEFTLRAFLAGRIDLLQAEGVLGVIDARDPRELQCALEQLGGGVSSQIVRLRGDLLDLLADLEAGLDFAEEDIEFVTQVQTVGRIGLAREVVTEMVRHSHERWQSAARPRVVLAGPPNAGKSTLFNALLGTDAAITSEERGTTRDYLVADVTSGGAGYTLVDTAGRESESDGIEGAAQDQRRAQMSRADLIVWCLPADDIGTVSDAIGPERLLVIGTKTDLAKVLPRSPIAEQIHEQGGLSTTDLLVAHSPRLFVSVHTRFGLEELKTAIATRLADPAAGENLLLGTTAARCRDSLHGAALALDRALTVARQGVDHELLAIELREALEELGKIVGAVYTDDILDRIFSKFCIGK